MTKAANSPKNDRAVDDYLDLVCRFALRPIRTRGEYNQAIDILGGLVGRADAGLTSGERDYADVLGQLIDKYEQPHSGALEEMGITGKISPIEALKYLMEEHGMNTITLGKLVGGSGQASMILNGKRELSKANIRTLAAHFHVSPALFI
ncbi:MAG: hypothetical protein IT446_11535 [Phycisphaerales bacterium]|jgi:HTH-type transcriptional regulator/antitoxin HigA|nr:hypothetical protein [Phycisphaerales bacterium]